MVSMRIEFTSDDAEGAVHLRLYSDATPEQVHTMLRDTEAGFEVRTIVTDTQGKEHVLSDKTDRATPPMVVLMNAIASFDQSFSTNAQAVLNRQRLARLVKEARPVTVQNMCMCGHHKGDEFDVPFEGGIVGIPTYTPEPDETQHDVDATSDVSDDFLSSIWGEDEDDADDSRDDGVEV